MNAKRDRWRLERRISISALVQVMLLAGLIVGSWMNLQRQLDGMQRDVRQVLSVQEKFDDTLHTLRTQTLAHEYRLRTLEQQQ